MADATRARPGGSPTEKSDFSTVPVEDSRQPPSKPRTSSTDGSSIAWMGGFTAYLALDLVGYCNHSGTDFVCDLRGYFSESARGSTWAAPNGVGGFGRAPL